MFEPQRVHPIAILLVIVNFIKKSWRDLLPGLIGLSVGLSQWFSWWMIIPIPIIALIYSSLYWWNFTFSISDNQLVIKKGVLNKNLLQIPKERIQVIDSKSSLLQQLFMLETLSFETAGKNENAVLFGVTHSVSDQIVGLLGNSNNNEFANDLPKSDKKEKKDAFFTLSTKSLIVHGLTSKTIGIIIAAIFYLQNIFNDFLDNQEVKDQVRFLFDSIKLYIWLSIIVFILATVLIAVVYTFIVYFKFRLDFKGDDLIIQHGLFETKRITLPVRRIQLYKTFQNPFLRLLGLYRVYIESAGSNEKTVGNFIVFPLTERDRFEQLFTEVQIRLGSEDLTLPQYSIFPPKKSYRRFLLSASILPLILGLILFFILNKNPFSFLILLISIPIAFIQFKGTALAYSSKLVRMRSAFFALKEKIIPINSIQSYEIEQNVFQKRSGIHSIILNTKNGNSASSTSVHYLDEKDTSEFLAILKKELRIKKGQDD